MIFIEQTRIYRPTWSCAHVFDLRSRSGIERSYPYMIDLECRTSFIGRRRRFRLRSSVNGPWFIECAFHREGDGLCLPTSCGQLLEGTFILPGGTLLVDDHVSSMFRWLRDKEDSDTNVFRDRTDQMHNDLVG